LQDAKSPIYDHYFFWVSIGLFIYLGGSFFIYIYANDMTNEELIRFWDFTFIVEIIKNLFYGFAIFIYYKNPSIKKSSQVIPDLDFML
jgi:hypothetical protein